MLQMALKMATGELDEPAVDLEAALTPNTITPSQAPAQAETPIENDGKFPIFIFNIILQVLVLFQNWVFKKID